LPDGDHFHLAVETPEANLGAGMGYLKSRYAVWFNQQDDRQGALFERRYFDQIVENEAHACGLARYIVLNPVRAKLCAHPSDWRSGLRRLNVAAEVHQRLDCFRDEGCGLAGVGEAVRACALCGDGVRGKDLRLDHALRAVVHCTHDRN
jgi:hypothetical protein